MTRDSDPIVFSTDGSHRKICPSCDRNPCACPAVPPIVPEEAIIRLRLDKTGRRGKSVTVLSDLPPHPDYFVRLTKMLKAHCGTGGAFKEGRVEIQGDQRDKVQAYLEQMGFTVHRASN